jgi:hypothetical protein
MLLHMKNYLKRKLTRSNIGIKEFLCSLTKQLKEGVTMSKHLFTPLMLCSLLAVSLLFLNPTSLSWASDEATGAGHKLAVIGAAGSNAIDVKISAQKPGGGAPGKDDPVSVLLTPSARAYITAVYISPQGDAVVVFPNKKISDNLVTPGKDYTIVSPDCGLKLGFSPTSNKGKIVVYVSSQPIPLDPFKAPEGEDFITISHDDAKDMEVLANKVAAISKDDHFNRKIITPDNLARPGQGDSIMGLPAGVASTQPESVAGVQGVKSKIKALGKD